ncbi:MAG: molybdopterin-guanine dinucleotide biosynthesis protein A [Pseudomonadota bacterium]
MARLLLPLLLLASILALPATAEQQQPAVIITPPDEVEGGRDRHIGYYYGPPNSQETFTARATPAPDASRGHRVGFVTGLEVEIAKRGHPIPYAIFAKGAEAQKLIIVALQDGPMDTLFRARGVLANLTAQARLTPLLRENNVSEWFTFFDLARVLGFEQITITDGKSWTHQVFLR